MSQLQRIFNYRESQVRAVIKDGQPWFVAKDVCDVLDHSNSRMAIDRLDEDEKGVSIIDTPGGPEIKCTNSKWYSSTTETKYGL